MEQERNPILNINNCDPNPNDISGNEAYNSNFVPQSNDNSLKFYNSNQSEKLPNINIANQQQAILNYQQQQQIELLRKQYFQQQQQQQQVDPQRYMVGGFLPDQNVQITNFVDQQGIMHSNIPMNVQASYFANNQVLRQNPQSQASDVNNQMFQSINLNQQNYTIQNQPTNRPVMIQQDMSTHGVGGVQPQTVRPMNANAGKVPVQGAYFINSSTPQRTGSRSSLDAQNQVTSPSNTNQNIFNPRSTPSQTQNFPEPRESPSNVKLEKQENNEIHTNSNQIASTPTNFGGNNAGNVINAAAGSVPSQNVMQNYNKMASIQMNISNANLNNQNIQNQNQQNMPYLIQNNSNQPPMLYQIKPQEGGNHDASVSGVNASNQFNQVSPNAVSNTSNVIPSPINPATQFNQQSNVAGNIQQNFNNIQNNLTVVAQQMAQIQNTISNLGQQNPYPKDIISFLSNKWSQLKVLYVQLSYQHQNQQRSLLLTPNGANPNLISNPNAVSLLQQQLLLQNQMQGVQQQNIIRPNMMGNPYMRANNPMMMNATMGGPPGLARFQTPRNFNPQMNSFFGPGGTPRMNNSSQMVDMSRGRRGPKAGRKKRHYSSESEEEDDLTSSDVEISSQMLNEGEGIPIEDMELRRSSRRHVSKSYAHEFPDDSDNDEKKKEAELDPNIAQDLIPFNPSEQGDAKIMLIEKILDDRIVSVPAATSTDENELDPPTADTEIEEFYVKYKCFSYLHCEWTTAEDLKTKDRNALSKIKRYKIKKVEQPFLYLDDEQFNPDYLEVDRVLDEKETPDPNKPGSNTTCYLVKWCALPYDESTWEFEIDIDKVKIDEFKKREIMPDASVLEYKPRPLPFQWQKILDSPVYKNHNTLREYQLEGINWLLYEYHTSTNCILADEMGLGKTIQSIAFLIQVRQYGIRGPFLVIAPLSTIGNWYREFLSWSDFNVVVFHGTASSRSIIHRYELNYRDANNQIIPNAYKFEVLITTYEMILSENRFLSGVNWRIAVVDEAHRLKNRNCKLLENLSHISIEHRILLTGTPLQNTLDELFSLLNFLDPHRVLALEELMRRTGKLESNAQVQQIQAFLKPVILRRLKEDVEKNIAPKEETIIEVEMTTIQKKIYRGILERNLTFLMKGTSTSNLPNLMNVMMELRKCCNHPFLINGVEARILEEYNTAYTLDQGALYRRALVESSGKLVLVDKLIPKLKESGHKMLIFSQMVRVLDLIEYYLVENNILFERIDGGVRGNLRQAAIDRFSKPDSDRSVFLLCTKAGGLGINLTAADTVIIFDSDWNPQNDIQAQARCHRIGQNKAVKVYRLICRQTYEREMFDRASLKLGLDRAVLQNINNTTVDSKSASFEVPRTQLSKKDVEELLRKGAYAVVMDEDTEASAKFCSEDIEQILQRRATVVQLGGDVKGSTFAKASFTSEMNTEQIDVDDPNFWEKWASHVKVAPLLKGEIYDDKPRIRKTVRAFDEDPDVEFSSFGSDAPIPKRERSLNQQRVAWLRNECCKVEKNLLVYGWGRWGDIMTNGNFKTQMTIYDVEQVSRTILVFCWHTCKGDESFTEFVERAIRSTGIKHRQGEIDSGDINYKPYGKRARRKVREPRKKTEKNKLCLIQVGSDWKTIDVESLILDMNYKKHLQHYSSKILIRLKLLFIIDHYLLRDCKEQVLNLTPIDQINIPLTLTSSINSHLTVWWDEECDKSLIVGTFKHGYEKYSAMKTDMQLCFHKHIINPESKSTSEGTEPAIKRRGRRKKVIAPIASDEEQIENTLNDANDKAEDDPLNTTTTSSHTNKGEFPSQTEINTRLRRLINHFWKVRSKTNTKNKNNEAATSTSAPTIRSKWTRKEEADFYKAITLFGVEYDGNGKFTWINFRKLTPFEKKSDEMLNEYTDALLQRAKTLLQQSASGGESLNLLEGVLTVEKSDKIIRRLELFSKLRHALASSTDLNSIILTAPRHNELPDWWKSGHDLDLLKATAIYGLNQNSKKIFEDASLSFFSILKEKHAALLCAPELVPNVSDVANPLDLGIDMIHAIIRWPKIKTLIHRIYGLSMLILSNVWYDKYEPEAVSSKLHLAPLEKNVSNPIVTDASLLKSSAPDQFITVAAEPSEINAES